MEMSYPAGMAGAVDHSEPTFRHCALAWNDPFRRGV
jgi:hypothetical protein